MNRSHLLAAVLCTALVSGCSWSTADPEPTAPTASVTSQPTPTLNAPAGSSAGGGAGRLARNPATWGRSSAADVVVPEGMSTVLDEKFGAVYAGVFNAGPRPKPAQLARWLVAENPTVPFRSEDAADGVRLVAKKRTQVAATTVDVIDTPTGVLVRLLVPSR